MAFCCLNVPVFEEGKEALVLDLQKILCDKAWKCFRASFGPIEKLFLKRENFIIEVPENFFAFEKIEQKLSERKPLASLDQKDPGDGQGNTPTADTNALATKDPNGKSTGRGVLQDMLRGRDTSRHHVSGPEYVSLDTEFSNDTANSQTYKFRFEKQRKSEINVSFQRGFTFGGKANFSVDVPAGVNLGAEATMQYQVTRADGERFEETMLMEATSDILVGPNSCYTANVQLEERSLHYNFAVRMRMSMPEKVAPIYIKRKNDEELVFVYNVKNLSQIFKSTVDCAKEVKDKGKARSDMIDFIIHGVIKGSLACNHKIQLKSDESPEQKKKASYVRFEK